MNTTLQDRLSGIDLVRVIAIIWICLYHLLDLKTGWQIGTMFGSGEYWEFFTSMGHGAFEVFFLVLIALGAMGVNLFIIASGLGLTFSANSKNIGYGEFLKKRVLKIFPYYWLILIAILLLELISGAHVNFVDYFLHFLGINNFFPEYVLSISAPFWFIGTILQLYLLFPLLFKLSKKIHPALMLLFALLLKVFVDSMLTDFFGGGRFFTEYIIDFVLGIIIGNMIFEKSFKLFAFRLLAISFIFVLSIGIITTVNLYASYPLFSPLIFQFASVLLFVILFHLGNLLSAKMLLIVNFLSSLSFAVYLTHYYFLTKLFSRVLDKLPFLIEALTFVLLSFLLAAVLNYFLRIMGTVVKNAKPSVD